MAHCLNGFYTIQPQTILTTLKQIHTIQIYIISSRAEYRKYNNHDHVITMLEKNNSALELPNLADKRE